MVGVIAGVIGTLIMIAGNIALACYYDVDFSVSSEDDPDKWLVIPYLLTMLAIWYSLPLAWMKGNLFDPILVVIGIMIWVPVTVVGVFKSKDSTKRH